MATDIVNAGLLGTSSPNFRWQHNLGQGLQSILGNRDLAMALLANSGYSPQKRTFGEILGTSMLQANQAQQQRADDALRQRYMQAQIRNLENPDLRKQSSKIQEYEYAKQGGYKGSYEDWVRMEGQTSRPSAVQEWEHYNTLLEADKKNGTNTAQLYLEMKRNPNFQVKDINQIPTVVAPSYVAGTQTTPLSTLPQVTSSAAAVKQAESAGSGLGQAQGAIAGGIQTKGAASRTVLGMVDEAEKILDDATGSLGGAAVDVAAGAVGKSTKGAQAIAQLKVLQAGLMLNMPRMEGPQSDRDVQLYREAAASLGDPTVPNETKKAALKQIRILQEKYAERAQGQASQPFTIFPNGSQTSDGWTVLPGGIKVREKR